MEGDVPREEVINERLYGFEIVFLHPVTPDPRATTAIDSRGVGDSGERKRVSCFRV